MANAANSVDTSTNVRVLVRVRPPNSSEKNSPSSSNAVEVMDENVLVFDPKEESSPYCMRSGRRRRPRDINKRRQKDMKFAFDRVFGFDSTNEEVFEHSTRTVLDGLLSGYNCSVFAYGATGAGKTHTMLGTESQPGVIYFTMIHLYQHIAQLSSSQTCDVAVSYLEVYNEQIRDLLLPRGTLPIREDPNSGVIVTGLSLHKPTNAQELLYMLQFGNKNRTQHPTDANAESSRSHAVFQVFVRQTDRTANISAEVKVGKMCLVDLAGSERATVTKNRGARFREGANINRSLLALGNVINSLADQKNKAHIPYRDSKLTRLLKDSLGGNCRTIMIAAVSPSHLSYEDTYNTLKYADRAKNIRLNMKKNVLNVDFHISRYGKIVEELRKEITELKGKLQQQTEGAKLSSGLSLPPDTVSLLQGLRGVYGERCELRDQQLKQETGVRNSHWRLHCRRKWLHRASTLSHVQPQSLQKLRAGIEGLERKSVDQEKGRDSLRVKLNANTQRLQALHNQAATVNAPASSLAAQIVSVTEQKLGLEVEVKECHHHLNHLRRLARAQHREALSQDSLIASLLGLVQRQQQELMVRGGVPADISLTYHSLCQQLGQWGVSWADSPSGEGLWAREEVLHINSIIDIPLLPSAGVTVTPLVAGGHQTVDNAAYSSTAASLGCPSRVANTSTASAPTPAACAAQSLHPLLSNSSHPASLGTQVWRPNSGVEQQPGLSTNNVCRQNCSSGTDCNKVFTSNAGHTPNVKRLGASSAAAEQGHIPAGLNSSGSVSSCLGSRMLPTGGSACDGEALTVPAPHGLNETFSLDQGGPGCVSDSTARKTNDEQEIIGSVLMLPIVDVSSSPSASRLRKKDYQSENVPADPTTNKGLHSSDSAMECIGPPSYIQAATGNVLKCDETLVNRSGNENDSKQLRLRQGVKRSIVFHDAASPPKSQKVEGMSYADALKTPTPPRQALRNLDCNSPLLHTRLLPGGSKPAGQSTFTIHPDTVENVRRLKQLGMPSLLEDHVTSQMSGRGSNEGVSGSKPSYMQPTKATALRLRHQLATKDDTFYPKRLTRKPLARSRSKSTSLLTKSGWKI